MNRKAPDQNHLPVGKLFAWKSRDVSLACVTVIISGYLIIFCTNALGMPAALVGTILMASRIFDGSMDLFAGFIVDNTNTKWGKGRPYEICIVLEWLCTLLLFCVGDKWALPLKCAWVFIMYTMIFGIFNTLLNASTIPYMVRAFSGNRLIIAKVSSYGGIVSMIGSMIVSVLFPQMMARLATSTGGWRTLIAIFAVPLAAIGILRFIFVKEDPSIDAGKQGKKVKIKEVFTMLKTNKYVWFFAGIVGFYNLIVGLNISTYYFVYVVGNVGLLSVVGMLSFFLLPVMFLFPTLMKKFSVSNLVSVFAVMAVFGYAIIFFAVDNMIFLLIGSALSVLASLPISFLQAICIMELSNYNEYNNLPRMEGSTGIVSGFAAKFLGGVGTGLMGILLGASGFISTTSEAAVVQPERAMMMIRLLYSVIPLICMVIILLCSIQFSKLEKRMPEIEKEVEARKAAAINNV